MVLLPGWGAVLPDLYPSLPGWGGALAGRKEQQVASATPRIGREVQ